MKYKKGAKMGRIKSDAEKLETLKNRYKKQNEYIEKSFDRVSVTLPRGTKERITAAAGGASVNAFIKSAIFEKLENIEK